MLLVHQIPDAMPDAQKVCRLCEELLRNSSRASCRRALTRSSPVSSLMTFDTLMRFGISLRIYRYENLRTGRCPARGRRAPRATAIRRGRNRNFVSRFRTTSTLRYPAREDDGVWVYGKRPTKMPVRKLYRQLTEREGYEIFLNFAFIDRDFDCLRMYER